MPNDLRTRLPRSRLLRSRHIHIIKILSSSRLAKGQLSSTSNHKRLRSMTLDGDRRAILPHPRPTRTEHMHGGCRSKSHSSRATRRRVPHRRAKRKNERDSGLLPSLPPAVISESCLVRTYERQSPDRTRVTINFCLESRSAPCPAPASSALPFGELRGACGTA